MKTRITLGLGLLILAGPNAVCAAQGEKYALVIGITGYPRFPASRQLRFADQDAQLFYDFITTPEGGSFPAGNIRLL